MTPEVVEAIDEIRSSFPEAAVDIRADDEGGAVVLVDPVDPGPQYQQRATWVGFRITFQYPYSE